MLQLTIPSQHGRLRAGSELAAVAVRGVRGALPADALRQHLPLLRHDLQLLQDRARGGAGGEGGQRVHSAGGNIGKISLTALTDNLCAGLRPVPQLVGQPVRLPVQPGPPGHAASVRC